MNGSGGEPKRVPRGGSGRLWMLLLVVAAVAFVNVHVHHDFAIGVFCVAY
jgi:hypothetical protein